MDYHLSFGLYLSAYLLRANSSLERNFLVITNLSARSKAQIVFLVFVVQ